ncbi:MAG: enoyl-CoA hydratase [Ponticaulis sp.]|nr:enoyl-CoA hydratase [Ponticaulis sp.]|tara:strand:+ start:20802 stop:21557 length:756 start_codon:yes stop_codon:yes gene_type:complete
MTDFIQVAYADKVCTITINRPEAKNAINQAMYGAIADALTEADERADVRVVLLRAEGDIFTAGNDLRDFQSSDADGEPPVRRFLRAIRDVDVPFVIAVNGAAIGIGLTMLLHADLVISDDTASFKAPFAQIGVVPEAGSSVLLPQAVGIAWANDILLTGRSVNAQEALSIGLISRVYPAADLQAEAVKLSKQIAAMAPNAMKESKRLIRSGRDVLAEHMDKELAVFAKQLESAEFKEAATAFFEKRPPVYD